MAFPFVALNKLAANAVITKPNYLCDGFREFLFKVWIVRFHSLQLIRQIQLFLQLLDISETGYL